MASLSLHIGVPKTATSYIQGWLQKNRELLLEAGVFVPEKSIYPHRIAVELLHGEAWDNRADVVQIRKTSLAEAEDSFQKASSSGTCEHLIMSSEYFYYCDPKRTSERLREMLSCTLNVVVYIRSQGGLVLSGHNQDVKKLGKTKTRHRPHYQRLYDWGILLDSWAKEIGKERLKVISFDVSSRDQTVLKDFIQASCPSIAQHFEDGVFSAATFMNESLPADLLEFKRIANAWGEFGLDDWLAKALQEGFVGPRSGVGPEEANAWRALYEKQNRYVAREYFGADDPEAVFPTPPEHLTGVDLEGQLPVETVAKLLGFALRDYGARLEAAERRVQALEKMLARQQMLTR